MLAAKYKIVDKQIQAKVGGAEGRLSPRQADAILELQLYRLTRLSTEEILKELEEIRLKIAEYESILASDKKLRARDCERAGRGKRKISATNAGRRSPTNRRRSRWKT